MTEFVDEPTIEVQQSDTCCCVYLFGGWRSTFLFGF